MSTFVFVVSMASAMVVVLLVVMILILNARTLHLLDRLNNLEEWSAQIAADRMNPGLNLTMRTNDVLGRSFGPTIRRPPTGRN